MSYAVYMNYVGRLYKLYELHELFEYFVNCLKIPWNHLKSVEIAWNIFFVLNKISFFVEHVRKENPNYKNEDIELEDNELKEKVKIKRAIEELFLKPIIVSIDDMDKFEEKEMNKVRPIENTWYD